MEQTNFSKKEIASSLKMYLSIFTDCELTTGVYEPSELSINLKTFFTIEGDNKILIANFRMFFFSQFDEKLVQNDRLNLSLSLQVSMELPENLNIK